jgi:hypothetical protein
LDPARPIAIGGSGILQGPVDQQLWLTVVTIEPQAQVIARDLVIQTSLCLQSNSTLRAAPQDKIILVPDLELEFRGATVNQLPYLDLGDIGVSYNVVPSVLKIAIESGSSSIDVEHLLVQGRTLSTCVEWQSKSTGLSRGFEMKCKTAIEADQSMPGAEPVVGLFIVKASDDRSDLSRLIITGAAIAGIAVGFIVLVAGISLGAVWLWVLRKRRTNPVESSPPAAIKL